MKTTVRRQRRLLCCAISALLLDASLHAATLKVGSADDDPLSTACNLRAALASIDAGAATAACSGGSSGTFGIGDKVVFEKTLGGATITLKHGALAVHKSAILHGGGQVIDANFLSRALYSDAPSLTLSDLTLTHGSASGALAADSQGGAIQAIGAALELDRVQVIANAAGEGGGIFVAADTQLTLQDSVVRDNTASGRGGGISFLGSRLRIDHSTLSGNAGQRAGALLVHTRKDGSDVAILSSTVSGNTAVCRNAYCGGAMYIDGPGSFYVGASTISDNQASGTTEYLAGAIYVYGMAAVIANSTIANNRVTGADFVAGAVLELHNTGDTTSGLSLVQSTVSANAGASNAGGTTVGGGLVAGAQVPNPKVKLRGSLALANSIVAGNSPDNDVNTQNLAAGTLLSARYSVLGEGAKASPFDDPANHNVFTDDPGLDPLADNGGPTATMRLLPASHGLAAGSKALAQVGGAALPDDQRGPGFPRFDSAQVDAGAFQDQRDRVFGNGFD